MARCTGSQPANRIRPAGEKDLPFLLTLLKRNGSALGFLSRAAIVDKIEERRIRIGMIGSHPAGYLVHGSLARPEVRVFQIAVASEARRMKVGQGLVADLLARARKAGAAAVSLRCLAKLAANAFWQSIGFRLIATEPGAKGALNVWGLLLTHEDGAGSFDFHSRIHPCPRCGRPTTDTWQARAIRRRCCRECVLNESAH